jgi:transcriptional regulator with XRE-family HTH domain
MEPLTTLAERTAYLVRHSALAPAQLSKLANLGASHVGQIVAGKVANPSTETASRIAAVCGATLDWLLRGHGSPPDPDAVARHIAAVRLGHTLAEETTAGRARGR